MLKEKVIFSFIIIFVFEFRFAVLRCIWGGQLSPETVSKISK